MTAAAHALCWELVLRIVAAPAQVGPLPNRAVAVAAALDFGRSQESTPYFLSSIFRSAKDPVGAVYTPFIRVALVSRTASNNGEVLSIDQVPAEAQESVIHVLMPDHDTTSNVADRQQAMPYRMVIERSQPKTGAVQRIEPIRLVHEIDTASPAELKRERRGVVIGTFALEALEIGDRIVLFQNWPKPTGGAIIHRTIGIVDRRISLWDQP